MDDAELERYSRHVLLPEILKPSDLVASGFDDRKELRHHQGMLKKKNRARAISPMQMNTAVALVTNFLKPIRPCRPTKPHFTPIR